MADLDENDSTDKSGAASADPSDGVAQPGGRASGSHALGANPPEGLEPDGLLRDDAASESDQELVAVGAPVGKQLESAGASADGVAAARGRSKKAKATARQKQVLDKEHRTGPVTFVRESIGELQKVVYPTGQQLVNYFVVVLIFVLFIIAIVSLLDLAFGKAILAVFS